MSVKSKERDHPEGLQTQQLLRGQRIPGFTEFCRLWIPGFPELSWLLYEATRGGKTPLDWTPQIKRAFNEIKVTLLNILILPEVTRPCHLYVDEKKEVAKGVLMQTLGPWQKPITYLSKKLDPVATG